MKPKIIAVTGATASGKSALALQLASRLNAEIVCMDSMQIYTGMDIGTAKPTLGEQQQIPHHMLDIVDPSESFAVADYATRAETVFAEILSRGRLPVLVGGTGLYLKALMHGLSLGVTRSDPAVRARYEAIADQPNGKKQLHQMLAQVDEASARKLHPNDIRRVIRALEVFELTGVPISQTHQEDNSNYHILPLAISMDRDTLYQRIEKRTEQMFRSGLVREVQALLDRGISPEAQSMQGIGYKELIPALQGVCSQEDAKNQIVLNTKHYAKRQETWFKGEKATVWLESANALEQAMEAIHQFMNQANTKESLS